MSGDQFAAYVLRPSASNGSPTSSSTPTTNSNSVPETRGGDSNSDPTTSTTSLNSADSREDSNNEAPSRESEAVSSSISGEADSADGGNQDYRGVFAIFRARDNNSWNFHVTSDESSSSSELMEHEATTNSVTFESSSPEPNSGVSMSLSTGDTDMYSDTSTVTLPEPPGNAGGTETPFSFNSVAGEAMPNSDEPIQEPSDRVVGVGRVINVGPSSSRTSYLSHGSNHSSSFATLGGSQGSGTAVATATARTFRHVHTAVVVADGNNGGPQFALRTAINRAIAGAFAGCGEGAVASNIISTTHRLQWWDFSQVKLPDLKNSKYNILQLAIHYRSHYSVGTITVLEYQCTRNCQIPKNVCGKTEYS